MTRYLIWRPEYGQEPEDGTVVDACDANAAACKWAERYDADASHLIVRGRDETVSVRAVNNPSDAREMIVSGESVPHYRARIALSEKCGPPPGCPDCKAAPPEPGFGELLPCCMCGGKPYAYDMRGIMHEPACTVECGSCDHDIGADTPAAAAAKWHAARA